MAQKITFSSGSVFCGNPIFFQVIADNVGSNASFHRVYLQVTIAPSAGPDLSQRTFLLTNTVDKDLNTYFDVSSVVRSSLSRSTFTPISQETASFPYAMYQLKAWDEYMKDGIIHTNVGILELPDKWYGMFGEFMTMERYGKQTLAVTRLTDKPASGEICGSNEVYVSPLSPSTPLSPAQQPTEPPSSKAYSLSGHNGEYVNIDGRSVYVIDNKDLVHIQFLNRFGVIESISAHRILSESIESDVSTLKASSGIGFGDIPITKAIHSDKTIKLTCTTGYINREWADWWQNNLFAPSAFRECIQSNTQWVKIGNDWVPCAITMNECNYESNELVSIDFSIAHN